LGHLIMCYVRGLRLRRTPHSQTRPKQFDCPIVGRQGETGKAALLVCGGIAPRPELSA